ncbi:MAG: TPM domain-containing protein [Candidatus Omnitrophica bacterium]|nr:TPM domain-containing protein [Candidatus Omnitrophota bacterium]
MLCVPAFAFSVPDKPAGYVNDYAGLLSNGARSRLEEMLANFERKTSNQIVVATFPSLEGGSLEDFSIRLAERWKIGSAKNDNGVILLIFRDDRQVRIEVGYGLEGVLPDVTASRIIRNEIVPAFRAGDMDGGIEKAVLAIMAATKGEYQPEEPIDKIKPYAPYLFLLLVVFMYFLIHRISHFPGSGGGRGGGWGGGRWRGGSSGGSGWKFGGGGGGGFGGGGSSGKW